MKKIFLVFVYIILGLVIAVSVHLAINLNLALAEDTSSQNPALFSQKNPHILEVSQNSSYLLFDRGQAFYENGENLAAIKTWQQAAADAQSRGDSLQQALILSYISLVYQELGQQQQAESLIKEAINLIPKESLSQRNAKFSLAGILNNQGQIQLNYGQLQTAFDTWKRAEIIYRDIHDITGQLATQINQSIAMQSLGLYRQAKKELEQVYKSISSQTDSKIKFHVLLNLGNSLRLMGDFTAAQEKLAESLALAKKIESSSYIQIALFNLANLAYAKEEKVLALELYQKAAAENSPIKIPSQIHQLKILIALNRLEEARSLLPLIQTQLANLPLSQIRIYAQIQLAESLAKINPQEFINAAKILADAQKQAKNLGNFRAESYALGKLGRLYEQTQQWQDSKRLTEQALILAQAINADEITYQWHWQLGRLLKATGEQQGAIANYTEAVNILQSLRQELSVTNQDAQFSFRESVEPVYRELIDLLLQDNPDISEIQKQKNIQQALATIEELQVAELANFFREGCLDVHPKMIDRVDSTAAVIYPIILRDRLEVILSLPNQPLRHYATLLSQEEVISKIAKMRQSLRRTSFMEERLTIANEIYTWLIKPAVADLNRYQIKTLVFILDGLLRNLPMAALYDGKQYLIEKYAIAIAPSLQLLNSQPVTHTHLKALLGGLTEGSAEFTPLPGVKEEIKEISTTVRATILLDQQFTNAELEAILKKVPFTIMHLATHGQFSSKAEETFILTWNGRIGVKELDTLLAKRDRQNSSPIELLVLSACQTAKGDNRAALGLAGVAVRSGARSTLASLWTVSDQSTANLMVNFYTALVKPGVNKAEALQQAQLQLLKQSEFSHPYFWASFILVGSWL